MKLNQYSLLYKDFARKRFSEWDKEELITELLHRYSIADWKQVEKEFEAAQRKEKEGA